VDEEKNYKHPARCRYFASCYLYNANVLTEQAELNMCGKGQPKIDESYIPRMPVDPETNITTEEMYEEEQDHLFQKVCNAFYGIAAEVFESDVSFALFKFQKEIGRKSTG
jgi:hypothetical protein